jgi:hypothetical protein
MPEIDTSAAAVERLVKFRRAQTKGGDHTADLLEALANERAAALAREAKLREALQAAYTHDRWDGVGDLLAALTPAGEKAPDA